MLVRIVWDGFSIKCDQGCGGGVLYPANEDTVGSATEDVLIKVALLIGPDGQPHPTLAIQILILRNKFCHFLLLVSSQNDTLNIITNLNQVHHLRNRKP